MRAYVPRSECFGGGLQVALRGRVDREEQVLPLLPLLPRLLPLHSIVATRRNTSVRSYTRGGQQKGEALCRESHGLNGLRGVEANAHAA